MLAASCADLVEIGDQSLLVNDMVGIIAGEYVYKLLNHLPIFSFLTYVDTESLSMRSVPITADNVKTYMLSGAQAQFMPKLEGRRIRG